MEASKGTTAMISDSSSPDTASNRKSTGIQKAKNSFLKRFQCTLNPDVTRSEKVKNCYKDTPIAFQVLFVWSLFEIILCLIVLRLKTENNVTNFMASIGEQDVFKNCLVNGLYARMILSTISIVGIAVVRVFFCQILRRIRFHYSRFRE